MTRRMEISQIIEDIITEIETFVGDAVVHRRLQLRWMQPVFKKQWDELNIHRTLMNGHRNKNVI